MQALYELINTAERSLHHAKNLMSHFCEKKAEPEIDISDLHTYKSWKSKVIEGVFTGKDMVGADKKVYPVPANYASKSKIVEWSKLKMTIKADGSYHYKIIDEVLYETSTGTLIKDRDHFVVITQNGIYQVLPASVSYLQAHVWDRVAIRIPKDIKATYATIDTLIPSEIGLIEA